MNPMEIYNPFYTYVFNKKNLTLNDKSVTTRDTVYRKNGLRFNDTLKYYFDSKKRLVKKQFVTQSWNKPTEGFVTYKYCNDNNYRLDSVITNSDEMIYTAKYVYENSLLTRSVWVGQTKHYKNGNWYTLGFIGKTMDTVAFYNKNKNKKDKLRGTPYETNYPDKGVNNPAIPNEFYIYLMDKKYKWPDSNNGSAPVEVSLYEYYPDKTPKRVTTFDLTGTYRGYFITDYFYQTE